MTLDVRGSLKNTRINKNPHVIIEELLSNAIDSYLIRKSNGIPLTGLSVSLLIEFYRAELFDKYMFKITCADNGAGFGDAQVKAFVTKDTSYKDQLGIAGIGKCKGLGRIQFFHYFRKMKIESIYELSGTHYQRTLAFHAQAEIEENSFVQKKLDKPAEIRTIIVLDNMNEEIYQKYLRDINLLDEFSAESLKYYVMISFLQRFVSLKEHLGNFQIDIETIIEGKHEKLALAHSDLPQLTKTHTADIHYMDESQQKTAKFEKFQIHHYKLSVSQYKLRNNIVAFCAKSAIVKKITSRYLKNKTFESNPLDGFFHIILIEADFLDDHVNEQRDDFAIAEKPSTAYEGDSICYRDIYDGIDPVVEQMLKPPGWDRSTMVGKVEKKYGISSDMIAETKIRIHPGDTEEKIAKRVLRVYEDKFLRDTKDIFDIKTEIEKTDPTSQEFRTKVNELAWKYASTLKTLDMTNLSQLVVRRAAIVEILSLAINKTLIVQTQKKEKKEIEKGEKERERNESIIHNIFFPQRRDSQTAVEHDIWLLNEEYQYFDYIASDTALSSYKLDLFEPDIDEVLNNKVKEIWKENYNANRAKRPDIAIFSKEGTAIIIEFKAPGVSLDDHTGDLQEYSQLLAAKSKGKLKKFYGYLIGTIVNKNRIQEYEKLPGGGGWYKIVTLREPDTSYAIGSLHAEILFYDDIVKRAKQRIEIYKKRLKFDINH